MSDIIKAIRYHDIDIGHRVIGQGGKCERLHGHRETITFYLEAKQLNDVGMVVDFGVIKAVLCEWLEDNWDHRFLIWEEDPYLEGMQAVDPDGVVVVPFNPTAENIALYLLNHISPILLRGLEGDLVVTKIKVEETRKCSVTVELDYG